MTSVRVLDIWLYFLFLFFILFFCFQKYIYYIYVVLFGSQERVCEKFWCWTAALYFFWFCWLNSGSVLFFKANNRLGCASVATTLKTLETAGVLRAYLGRVFSSLNFCHSISITHHSLLITHFFTLIWQHHFYFHHSIFSHYS